MGQLVSFGELYERYAADVLRFATFLTGDRAAGEDLTAEAFLRAWTRGNETAVRSMKAYLFAIVRNAAIDMKRSKAEAAAHELTDSIVDPAPDPDIRTVAKAELRRVMDDMQRLPESDRAALLMRAFDDLPYDEIAAILGISVAAAKVRVHRARKALQEARKHDDRHDH
jgi:RNA polymerase sigma-70 factor, ECF subfamily